MVTTADAVAEIWRRTRASWDSNATHHDGEAFRVMTDILDAAHAVPLLRRLHGSTSHFTLQFSTCLEHPWSDDIPVIEPRQFNECGDRSRGPGYLVRNRPRGHVIGEADDAESAITLLLVHLPADVGTAGPCRHLAPVPRRVIFNEFVADEIKRTTSEPVASDVRYEGRGKWSVSIRPAGAEQDSRMLVRLWGFLDPPDRKDDPEAILRDAARRLLTDAHVKLQPDIIPPRTVTRPDN